MKTEEILRLYKKNICPRCVHYVDKDYQECHITLDINQEANCINYKCSEFCKKAKKKNSFQQLLTM